MVTNSKVEEGERHNDEEGDEHESVVPSTSEQAAETAHPTSQQSRSFRKKGGRSSPGSRSSGSRRSSKASTPSDTPEVDRIPMKLASPVGGEAFTFSWPLRETAGYSEGQEFLDVIRSALSSFQELNFIIRNQFDLDSINKHDYNDMKKLFDAFNKAAPTISQLWKGATRPGGEMWSAERADASLLKQICARAYNRAVDNVHLLNNHYKAFSSETYGETSFERLQMIIQEIMPKERDVFVDLGSGVGQLVIQMAGGSRVRRSEGIEIAALPNKYARNLGIEFRKWMKWYGKKFRPFELHEGDFLDMKFRDLITKEATIIFINNFAFTADLETRIKRELLSELKDGTRIISTKPYACPNRTITDRHLNDISAIVDVYEMSECENACSWTSNYVPYYHHTINRSKLEKYFLAHRNPSLKHNGANGCNGSRRSSTSSKTSREGMRCGSRDSSVSTPVRGGTPTLYHVHSGNGVLGGGGTVVVGGGGGHQLSTARRTAATGNSSNESHRYDDDDDDDDHTTGPTTRRKWHEYCSELDRKRKRERERSNDVGESAGAAENDPGDSIRKWPTRDTEYIPPSMKKHRKPGQRGRPRKVLAPVKALPEEAKEGLDIMHQLTCSVTAKPASPLRDPSLILTDLSSPDSVNMKTQENSTSFHKGVLSSKYPELNIYLENIRHMYEKYMESMKSLEYADYLKKEIAKEQAKRLAMQSKIDSLAKQIDQLKASGVQNLHIRLSELGIEASTPTVLLENAKEIVAKHKMVTAECAALESEITALDLSNQQLEQKMRQRDEVGTLPAVEANELVGANDVSAPHLNSVHTSNLSSRYGAYGRNFMNNSSTLIPSHHDSGDTGAVKSLHDSLCSPPTSESSLLLSFSSSNTSGFTQSITQPSLCSVIPSSISSKRTRHRPNRSGPSAKRAPPGGNKLSTDPKEEEEVQRRIQDIVAKALEVDSAAKFAEKERRARGDKRREKVPLGTVTNSSSGTTLTTVAVTNSRGSSDLPVIPLPPSASPSVPSVPCNVNLTAADGMSNTNSAGNCDLSMRISVENTNTNSASANVVTIPVTTSLPIDATNTTSAPASTSVAFTVNSIAVTVADIRNVAAVESTQPDNES